MSIGTSELGCPRPLRLPVPGLDDQQYALSSAVELVEVSVNRERDTARAEKGLSGGSWRFRHQVACGDEGSAVPGK